MLFVLEHSEPRRTALIAHNDVETPEVVQDSVSFCGQRSEFPREQLGQRVGLGIVVRGNSGGRRPIVHVGRREGVVHHPGRLGTAVGAHQSHGRWHRQQRRAVRIFAPVVIAGIAHEVVV